MIAIANNQASRLLSALVPSLSRALQQGSAHVIRNLDPIDVPGLCGVTKVFVLVAASLEEGGSDSSEIAKVDPPPTSNNLLDAFERAPMPTDDRYIDSEAMIGDAKVNFATMEARRRGEPVSLTALQFKTLKFLITNARRVVSRDELLNEVWGYQNYPTTRTVDNVVAKLRKKLEIDPARPIHLRTVHGVGYKFLP